MLSESLLACCPGSRTDPFDLDMLLSVLLSRFNSNPTSASAVSLDFKDETAISSLHHLPLVCLRRSHGFPVVGRDLLAYGRDAYVLTVIPPADVAVT